MAGKLTFAEVDAAVARLGAEHDRISEALLDLDGHFGRKLLEGAALTGESLTRWSAAREAIAALWTHFEAYRTVLEQVRSAHRKPGRNHELLVELLTGPAVTVSGCELPVAGGGLTGPARVSGRLTLDELVATMNAAYARVIEVVASADQVWSELGPRFERARQTLSVAGHLAADLGLMAGADPAADELAAAAAELDALREQVRTDPLTLWVDGRVADPGVAALTARIDRTRSGLDALARLRQSAGPRLDGVAAAIREIAGLAREAAEARARTLARMARHAVPPAAPPDATLEGRLLAARRLRERGRWERLVTAVDALERDVADELARQRGALAAAHGPLAERDELRGRLDAYRAKAVRQGRGEERALEVLYQRAHERLWHAPCDLPAAAEAVARYQREVTTSGEGRER